jgi:hypothetical protein
MARSQGRLTARRGWQKIESRKERNRDRRSFVKATTLSVPQRNMIQSGKIQNNRNACSGPARSISLPAKTGRCDAQSGRTKADIQSRVSEVD